LKALHENEQSIFVIVLDFNASTHKISITAVTVEIKIADSSHSKFTTWINMLFEDESYCK
jgi:hypothetical protein